MLQKKCNGQRIPIILLAAGQRNVTIEGKICFVDGPHPFRDRLRWLCTLHVMDPTGVIRVVLWNNRALDVVRLELGVNDQILVSGAHVKRGPDDPIEVHTRDASFIERVTTFMRV